MMRTYTFFIAIAALVCVLLLAGVVLAQSGGGSDSSTWYTVEQGTASGMGYCLTSQGWRVSGMASGGGYHLLSPAVPELRGSGCCCTYIPCVLHNF